MKSNTAFFRTIGILLVSLLTFWIITSEHSPVFLRPLSLILRTGFTLVVPSVFFVLYLAFRLRGWLGDLLSLVLTLAIFGLALAGIWASGQTESGILSGVIPMFDSTDFFNDSLRLLAGKDFSDISTRRPLFAAFFAVLLRLTNFQLLPALSILTLLVTLACYLLAREINCSHGPVTAAFALVVIFIYYRFHSGAVRTENLGLLLGVLGTALIWRGISDQYNKVYIIAGIHITSLGLIARAGAFFILPLLVLWGAILFKPKGKRISWQFLGAGIIAVGLAFFANQLIMKSIGTGNVIPFGNFSYSFYGLAAGGKSWAYVTRLYPGADYPEIYKMAFRLILERPDLFLKGVAYNYSMFFSRTNYGLFSFMSGEGKTIASISHWILLLLSLLGVWNWYRHRKDPYLGFVMVSTIGLLLSVPFLPPTDAFRLRAYAASIVILAILPAMGLHGILANLALDRINPPGLELAHRSSLAVFSIFILVTGLFGPFVSKGTDPFHELDQSSCEAGLVSVVVRYDPGGMVHLIPQYTVLLDRAPNFHIGTFRRNVHGFPNFKFMKWALDNVAPNHTLFSAMDYRTFHAVLALVQSDILPAPPALLELCGAWEDDPEIAQFNIFYVSSVSSYDQE